MILEFLYFSQVKSKNLLDNFRDIKTLKVDFAEESTVEVLSERITNYSESFLQWEDDFEEQRFAHYEFMYQIVTLS